MLDELVLRQEDAGANKDVTGELTPTEKKMRRYFSKLRIENKEKDSVTLAHPPPP